MSLSSYAYTNQKLSSIAASGGVTIGFSHDARGNVIQKATVGFIWDRANRLARTGDQAYRYDGHGRRTWATTVDGNGEPTGGSTLTLYGRDGQLLLEERTGSAVVTGEIFANGFESGAPPAQAETRTYHWLGQALIARREQGSSGTTTTYLTGDVMGSVVAEVSASAAVTERTRYQPFGTPMSPRSGPGYTGHVMDRSGLIYMQGRYYDPDVGRFLGMDPVAPSLADGGDFNRYAYARNNPYRYTDSTGQYVETAWDVVNVAIGVRSFGANVAEGNWGAAALDAVGVVVDGLAVAAPLPGGAGTAIHMARAADAVVDAKQAIGRGDVASTAERATHDGGRYGDLASDGAHRHHMPSAQASPLARDDGPAIRMKPEDHRRTASYGGGPGSPQQAYRDRQAELIRDGRFDDAFLMDVDDIQSINPAVK